MLLEYVLVDHRWQEAHWLEAFRIRLCGWLPADIAADAISNGLFLRVHDSYEPNVVLTGKACRLTDVAAEVGESSQNCLMLANVLITKGFNKGWLTPEKHADVARLQTRQIFPKTFRDKIRSEIASIDLLNK
ncbi:hypothetical protein [Phaeobacter sp. NW0010-22]|uniref:hypothetical protein n=1 Tax=Phaeobacter sp. NW0010-22 TaxID=3135907 RepID=UPI00310BA6C1